MIQKLPQTRHETEVGVKADETVALRHYLQSSTSENTRRAYRSALRQFEKWGGRLPADRDTIVRYLLAKADQLNVRTLDLHLSAISQWHQNQVMNDPTRDPLVRKTLIGIRRIHGRPKLKARALQLEHIATMVDQLRSSTLGIKKDRDLALILTGFFGAFRRSELVSIQVDDLIWHPEGVLVAISKSKTDQSGSGSVKALPYGSYSGCCAASCLRIWLDNAGITKGPVFRPINRWGQIQEKELSPGSINELLKSIGRSCGFDFVPELSSHSFRRGLSTTAAREKLAFELIKKQGGWKSDATVWEYIEEGKLFSDNVANHLMGKLSELMEG